MRLSWLLFGLTVASCTPIPQLPFAGDVDLDPPVIISMTLRSAEELAVRFNEPVRLAGSPPLHSPSIRGVTAAVFEHEVSFRFDDPPDPAQEHYVEAQVSDQVGNSLRFVARFYGLNPLVPAMVINEFTTKGSGNNPDIVEILVLSDGNLAGAVLYEGTPGNWANRYIFPSVDVTAGEFIVVHFRPQGIPEEIDEVDSKATSGGLLATPTAWDFWVVDATGLSSNNGALSLCENPLGGFIDAVLYSNRTSASDERYRGFGSAAVLERADEVVAAGHWTSAGDAVAPEDAIDSTHSTATRSMSRGSDSRDTNSKADWHITPTRGLSPGAVNTDEVYTP